MKYFVIPNVWAVGMHHWGEKELEVGEGFIPFRETENQKDPNAIAIYKKDKKKGYLKRDNAFVLTKIMKLNISNVWRIKPKEVPVTRDRRIGPQQLCNIGCRIDDNTDIQPAMDILKSFGWIYEVKSN